MSPCSIHIIVPGAIVPWKRAQRRRFQSGAHVTFTDPEVWAYHGVVRMAAERAMDGRPPLDCPLEMSVLSVFAVPASWSGKRQREALAGIIQKTTKPDLDNSLKGSKDAMQSICYRNDSQIVSYGTCSKIYGDRPRLEIVLTPIEPVARAVAVGRPLAVQTDLFDPGVAA
jgi:Holliday junction resolvase RusA-like endonuclease